MAKKRWNDLTRGQQRIIIALGVGELVLKAAMLIDLRRRPAEEVRGPKWAWAASAAVNSAGLGSLAYFVVGRRRP